MSARSQLFSVRSLGRRSMMARFIILIAISFVTGLLNAQVGTYFHNCWDNGILKSVESNNNDKNQVCGKPSHINNCDLTIEKTKTHLAADKYKEASVSQYRGVITIVAESDSQVFPPTIASQPTDRIGFFTRNYRFKIVNNDCHFDELEVSFKKQDLSKTVMFPYLDSSGCQFAAGVYKIDQELQKEGLNVVQPNLNPMGQYLGRICHQILNQSK